MVVDGGVEVGWDAGHREALWIDVTRQHSVHNFHFHCGFVSAIVRELRVPLKLII